MKRTRTVGISAAVAVLLVGLPGGAWANGRFPATMTLSGRADAPEYLMLGATFGLVISPDEGATWGWVCEGAIGYMGTFDPIFVNAQSGALLASTFDGVVRSADDGCTWLPVAGLEGEMVLGLVEHPAQPGTFFAAGGGNTTMAFDAVYISTDDGLTFAPTSLTHTARFFAGIAISPADPDRVYTAGWYFAPRESFIHRSDNGGMDWIEMEHALSDPYWIVLLGLSNTDPNVVLWLLDGPEDSIMRSDDGGLTAVATHVFSGPSDPFAGFTVAADGTMYAVGLGSGLYRSLDDGITWENVAGAPMLSCLNAVGNRLYACANPFATGFALGTSDDGGQSFQTLYDLPDIDGVHDCPVGTPTRDMCEPLLPQLLANLQVGFGSDSGVPDAGVADGGVSMRDDDGNGGKCGSCRVAPGTRTLPAGDLAPCLAFWGLAASLAFRRRRALTSEGGSIDNRA